jgi:hypothetical protein
MEPREEEGRRHRTSICEPHPVIVADEPHIPGMDGGAGLGEAPSSEVHPPVAVPYWSNARRGEL